MTDYTLDVTVKVHHETDAAYLVSETGERPDAVWVPKSQIRAERRISFDTLELTLPQWLAEKVGFA